MWCAAQLQSGRNTSGINFSDSIAQLISDTKCSTPKPFTMDIVSIVEFDLPGVRFFLFSRPVRFHRITYLDHYSPVAAYLDKIQFKHRGVNYIHQSI